MFVHDVRGRIAFFCFISMMTVGGCAVGTAYVTAPPRLPSQSLPALAGPLSFDVCVAPAPRQKWQQHIEERRRAQGDRLRIPLRHAGVRAELTADAGSPVDFTVTLGSGVGQMGSAMLSLFTFSVVPGYFVELKTLNVDIAGRDGAPGGPTEHLEYQARTMRLIWLPLIVAPDFIFTVTDSLERPEVVDGGFRQMVERLGDDIRARRGRDDVTEPVSRTAGVRCPATTPAVDFRP